MKVKENMDEFPLKQETHNIIGEAMEVHRRMGPGFLEAVYQECLSLEFKMQDIPFVGQPRVQLEYRGHKLQKEYVPDFVCYENVIGEIKAAKKCGDVDRAQVINALKSSSKPVGLLMNFGESSLYWKRFANTRNESAKSGGSA